MRQGYKPPLLTKGTGASGSSNSLNSSGSLGSSGSLSPLTPDAVRVPRVRSGSQTVAGPDVLRLQRKIYTRWVNQKLEKKNIVVKDIVTDVSDGYLLVQLMETLSGQKFQGKIDKNAKMRVQKIDGLGNALAFVWSCGVQAKVKPSPEYLADGDERTVLSLIWAIMSQYLKITDESGQLVNAKEALLEWCQSKTAAYPEVKIENFSTSFQDGLAFCAIIHKHRPYLVNWERLHKDDKKECLQTAMDAATAYFGLEQYLTPDDIPKLDENSMLIYVSEYYYGIAKQRKLDVAANRIVKLIKIAKKNDDLKQEYVDKATSLVAKIEKAVAFLLSRTVDDSLGRAQHRIDDYNEYLGVEKRTIFNEYLNLESLFNNLNIKLSFNKRPAYVAPVGLSLADLQIKVNSLDSLEGGKKTFLNEELARQIKLSKVDQQHLVKYKKLVAWLEDKQAELLARKVVESISAAELQIKYLDVLEKEGLVVVNTSVTSLKKLGATLSDERFEGVKITLERESEIDSLFEKLGNLSHQRRNELQAELAKEIEKERLRIEYARLARAFTRWTRDTADEVDSDTNFGLSLSEVESYLSNISRSDEKVSDEAAVKISEYTEVLQALDSHGVSANEYTQTTPDVLASCCDVLNKSLAARREKYNAEVEKHRVSDEVAKQFAHVASAFVDSIAQLRHKVSTHSGSVEEQVQFVGSELERNRAEQESVLADLEKKASRIITQHNKHTHLGYKDVAVQWSQLRELLERKKAALTEHIVLKERRGVIPEQVAEISNTFTKFDEDHDGYLNKKELRQCMYELREEREPAEIDEIIAKYGAIGLLDKRGFTEFMLPIVGNIETKENVLEALESLAKTDDYVKLDVIKSVMNPSDVEYFVRTAPKKSDDETSFDYKAWVDVVLLR